MNIQAVILAAGKGSRMGDLPYQKSLLPAKTGKAIVSYAMKGLYASGFTNHHISTVVGHRQESIREYLGTDSMYVEQKELNGTGGAIKEVMNSIQTSIETLLIINGDDSLSCHRNNLRALLKQHESMGAPVTVELTPTYSSNVHKNTYVRGMDRHVANITSVSKAHDEFLTGICAVQVSFLREHVRKMVASSVHGECSLTTLFAQALRNDELYFITNERATRGMNTLEDWRLNMML